MENFSYPSAGVGEQVDLASEITGALPIANGGTNSSTALNNNRVLKTSAGAIVEAAAITAARAVISDANGIPTHSAVTSTELGYLSGVTSAVQTQLNARDSLLATVTGVDLNTTNKSTLYTVPASKIAIITKIVTRNASTSLTTAVFGFGFNASANDVVAAALHTTLTGSTLLAIDAPIAGAKVGVATDVFGVKCSLAQGATATCDIDVFGYLISV